jgi:hypothetical protein
MDRVKLRHDIAYPDKFVDPGKDFLKDIPDDHSSYFPSFRYGEIALLLGGDLYLRQNVNLIHAAKALLISGVKVSEGKFPYIPLQDGKL